jgi:hypothetical protein
LANQYEWERPKETDIQEHPPLTKQAEHHLFSLPPIPGIFYIISSVF